MINRRLLVAACIFTAGLLALSPASAHRKPVVMTTIEKIEGDKLGITHRFHAHDAVSILALDPQNTQPELDSLRSRAKVALYVSEHFLMATRQAEGPLAPVELKLIGAELEGEFLFVYQETELPASMDNMYARSDLLSEIGNDWLSHVNLTIDEVIRTITFSGKTRWKPIGR